MKKVDAEKALGYDENDLLKVLLFKTFLVAAEDEKNAEDDDNTGTLAGFEKKENDDLSCELTGLDETETFDLHDFATTESAKFSEKKNWERAKEATMAAIEGIQIIEIKVNKRAFNDTAFEMA